jgi:hypothetical protein
MFFRMPGKAGEKNTGTYTFSFPSLKEAQSLSASLTHTAMKNKANLQVLRSSLLETLRVSRNNEQ